MAAEFHRQVEANGNNGELSNGTPTKVPSSPGPSRPYLASYDYDAQHPDELGFKQGDLIEIVTKDSKVSGTVGWWTGRVGAKIGIFPCNVVQKLPKNYVRSKTAVENERLAFCNIEPNNVTHSNDKVASEQQSGEPVDSALQDSSVCNLTNTVELEGHKCATMNDEQTMAEPMSDQEVTINSLSATSQQDGSVYNSEEFQCAQVTQELGTSCSDNGESNTTKLPAESEAETASAPKVVTSETDDHQFTSVEDNAEQGTYNGTVETDVESPADNADAKVLPHGSHVVCEPVVTDSTIADDIASGAEEDQTPPTAASCDSNVPQHGAEVDGETKDTESAEAPNAEESDINEAPEDVSHLGNGHVDSAGTTPELAEADVGADCQVSLESASMPESERVAAGDNEESDGTAEDELCLEHDVPNKAPAGDPQDISEKQGNTFIDRNDEMEHQLTSDASYPCPDDDAAGDSSGSYSKQTTVDLTCEEKEDGSNQQCIESDTIDHQLTNDSSYACPENDAEGDSSSSFPLEQTTTDQTCNEEVDGFNQQHIESDTENLDESLHHTDLGESETVDDVQTNAESETEEGQVFTEEVTHTDDEFTDGGKDHETTKTLDPVVTDSAMNEREMLPEESDLHTVAESPLEMYGGMGDAGGDDSALTSQLTSTISLQQTQIDSLTEKLNKVMKRLDSLEANQGSSGGRSGPMKALPPRSAPASSRRQTLDPRSARLDSTDGGGASKPGRRSVMPPSLSKRFTSREKIPKEKDEPGTYRIYIAGRPVSFRLPEGYEQPENPGSAAPPEKKLQLDWVYGYRGRDCRNNILLLANGEIVYFTAAVCVIYNLETNTQRHYNEHTDDVKSIALHPDGVTVASGQVAGHARPVKGAKSGSKAAAQDPKFMPHVRIWNSATLETLKVIGAGVFDRAVACVSFSKTDGGSLLAAVDDHNDHMMSVWEWNKGARGNKIAEMKTSKDSVYQAEFSPVEANSIVCCGKNQLSFWTLDGKNLTKKMALFEKNDKPKFVTCLTFTSEGNVVTGDSNGNLFVWNKGSNKIGGVIAGAHDGVVFSVAACEDGSIISGGGKDRQIKTWDIQEKTTTNTMELDEAYGPCRTVVQNGDSYVVGTTKNCIISGADLANPAVVTQGHFGETWGLCEQKSDNQFITCAYDHHVKLWDSAEHKAVWDIEVEEPVHCVSLSPSADKIAVGSRTPNFYIYNTADQQLITKGSCGSEQLEDTEFSPDGKYVAFGSRDNSIYVYNVEEGGASLVGKCSGHTSFITHIDWSTDSSYLRSNSGDYELLYWEVPACKQYTDGDAIRNLEFATQNCALSLNTVGIWPSGADGTDINGCCVNSDQSMCASADDFGKVNLYAYPSRTPHAMSHTYQGHSSHVTRVRFNTAGDQLFSAGGKDSSILQWRVM